MKIISDKNNLQVLHEDNHIIVINKRVGDIVQGDKTGDKPLSEVIKEYMSSLGKRCLETMTPAERSKRAKIAGKTRWKKYYENKKRKNV